MKPVVLEFIPDRRWLVVWVVTAFVVAAGAGGTAMVAWKSSQKSRELQARLAVINTQITQLRAPRQEAPDPRSASTEQAMRVLQYDLNKVFASVENMSEPGTRLVNLSLDMASGALRVEYQLDSMPRASSVTAVLNGGHDRRPWSLDSISAGAATSGGTQPLPVRATWSSELGRL